MCTRSAREMTSPAIAEVVSDCSSCTLKYTKNGAEHPQSKEITHDLHNSASTKQMNSVSATTSNSGTTYVVDQAGKSLFLQTFLNLLMLQILDACTKRLEMTRAEVVKRKLTRNLTA